MSLRRRVVIAFAMFSAIVAVLATAAVFWLVHLVEDHVIERQLEVETDRALALISAGAPLSGGAHYRYYRGDLPAELHYLATSSPGIHELQTEDHEAHVSITELPGGQRLYLVFAEAEDPFGDWLQVGFAGVGLGIFAAGSLLGLVTARRIAKPLDELAVVVSQTPPSDLAGALLKHDYDAEVEVMVDRLVASLRAREAFAAREQRFTSFASHELRTPVSVIRGAAELLRAAPAATEPRVQRSLERIERATGDMQATIEALLWLARDPSTVESPSETRVAPIVEQIVAGLPAGKTIALDRGPELRVRAPAGVLEMAIGNLVRNAHHFATGTIAIAIAAGRITITDDGPGMTTEQRERAGTAFARGAGSSGYGLGLAIVKTICARFDWKLVLEPVSERGLRATLQFD